MEKEKLKPLSFAIGLNIKPFPYQADFLIDNSRRIIFVAGRQTGKTTMTAIKGLFFALTHPNSTILVVAPTWRQSNILFNRMQSFILTSFVSNFITNMTKTTIYFNNKSKIFCLPSGQYGDTIRGFTADLIIFDEGAYIPEEVYIAVEPALATKNGTLILIGTPSGKVGRFWEAFNSPFFSHHHATSYENPLISEEFLEEQKLGMTELQFKQEFLAEFIEEADLYFPLSLVDKSLENPDFLIEEKPTDGTYYLGIDVAGTGTDETAYVIVKKEKGILKTIYWKTESKKDTVHIVNKAIELIKKFKPEWIKIDSTGIGKGVYDELYNKLGGIVKGINFSSENERFNLYNNLKILMEKELIKIPNDKKFRLQFTSYTYESRNGKLKINKSQNAHDDLVDALALASYNTSHDWTLYQLPDQSI